MLAPRARGSSVATKARHGVSLEHAPRMQADYPQTDLNATVPTPVASEKCVIEIHALIKSFLERPRISDLGRSRKVYDFDGVHL
jgi:hypothetical protein